MKMRVMFAAWAIAIAATPTIGADSPAERMAKQGEALLDSWAGERGVLIEADKKINAALKLEPKSSQALVQRARLLIMAGWSFDEERLMPEAGKAAEEALLAAAAADPKSAKPHVLLGHLYTVTKDYTAARKSLIRAEAMGSKDPWLYLNWSSLYVELKEHYQALAMAETALATGTTNQKALRSAYEKIMWLAAEYKHDRKRSDGAYDALIVLQPSNGGTRAAYARTVIVAYRDFATAEALATEALAIVQYRHPMETLSMALYGQWADAIDRKAPPAEISKLYARARQFDPDSSMIPECATHEPAMKSVMKHLAAKGLADATRQRC